MRTAFRNPLVSAAGLLAVLALAPTTVTQGLAQAQNPQAAAPAEPQQQAVPKDQIRPITGLPLPPDDPNYVPPPPAPKPLTRAQKLAAERKAATEAANARIAAAKAAAAEKAAANKAAAEKAAADREAARAAAAEKAEADKKAAADKLAAEKAAAADKLATEKAAAEKAAADKAAARKAAADKLAADRAAAAEKAAAAKAAADEAAANKAAAAKAAAEEKAAAAKASAEKASADREAARKAAADKLAADRAAAADKAAAAKAEAADKAAAVKAATEKALADKEAARKAAADKLAAAKAAAADKALADKAAADKLAGDKAVAAKAAADKAAEDRIAAEKAAAEAKAAAGKRSPFVPSPTSVTMPTATAGPPPNVPVVQPVTPIRPSVVRPAMPSGPEAPPPAKPQPVTTAPAAAPAPAPTSGVAAIVFFGADPFTPAELTPVTGIAVGSSPTSETIQKASRRLLDTGLFSNVAATYDINGSLGTATFSLKPATPDQLLRASFANFVWLTPAELNNALRSVAFYHGLVPAGGNLNMAADIEAALTAALKAKGVTATIAHAVIPPSDFHPYPAMEFRVTDPDTVLETAQVTDVPPSLVNKVLKAQDDAVKMNYNEGSAGITLNDVLLAPAREAGYLGAKLTRVEHKRKATPGAVYIDYSARLEVGPVYNVRSASWTPSPIYTAADFKRDSAIQVGKAPSPAAIAKTESAILASYRAQGYLEAAVTYTDKLDPATGAIDYTFSATPGPQYHLHALTVHGLSDQAQKDFDGAWTIQPGDIYNEDYLLNFLNAHRNIASLSGYTFDYNRTATPDTHEVDLTLNFKPAK